MEHDKSKSFGSHLSSPIRKEDKMYRKLLAIIGITVLTALAAAGVASADAHGLSLTVVPQTTFVLAGQNAAVNYVAANNTGGPALCSLSESGFLIFSGTLENGQDVGGQYSTPALYKNAKLVFVFSCNVSVETSYSVTDTVNIKVR